MKPSSTNKTVYKYRCRHCPFKARRIKEFVRKHEACHDRNPAAEHQCPLCSYSVYNLGKLNSHLELHYREISEGSNNRGDQHENEDSTNSEHGESMTKQDEQGMTALVMNQNTDDNSSIDESTADNEASPKRKTELWHYFPNSKRKRRKLCDDCDFDTLHQSSLDRHIELLHPITATTAARTTTTKEKCNNIDDHQNAEKDDGILPVVLNNIEERRVSLHDIRSSPAEGSSENMELLPLEESDQVSDVDEPEDGKIKSLQGRLMVMKEKARIAQEEVTQILSKKMNVEKRIIEVTGRRVVIELDWRLEERNLLEMRIFAHDAEEDYTGLVETVERKVGSLKKKMDAVDGQLISLKGEKKSLDYDLEWSRASHFGVVQVIEALDFELDGLFHP